MFLMSVGALVGIIVGGVILLLIIVCIAWAVSTFNKLVGLRNRVKNALAQIDVQLKKRFDLIPNLVETVKGYTKVEEGIFTKFAEARGSYTKASQAGDVEGMAKATESLGSVVSRLLVVSEQYPELKSDKHYTQLMADLKDLERQISYARQFYNDTVQMYNNKVEMFPSSIIANMKKFEVAKFFEIQNEEQREAPKVQF